MSRLNFVVSLATEIARLSCNMSAKKSLFKSYYQSLEGNTRALRHVEGHSKLGPWTCYVHRRQVLLK